MDMQKQSNEHLQKIADLIKDIKFAMLTTTEADGTLRSRPLSTAQIDEDGALWFFTGLDSPKNAEIQMHHQVNVSYANPAKQDYVSVSGFAETIRDREKMKSLWTPWIKPWFPDGVDDPNLALLKVTITEAEYWDAPGSAVARVYGLTKAIITGNTDALGENEKVRFPH